MKNFAHFLLGQDRLGHRFSLNFKGRESHNTWFGTIISLTVTVLVLIILSEKTLDMVFMRDPSVQLSRRPMLKEEVEDTGTVNLSDLHLKIGFVIFREEYDDDLDGYIKTANVPLPEDMSLNHMIEGVSLANLSDDTPFVSCRDFFSDVDDLTEVQLEMIELGSCLDP